LPQGKIRRQGAGKFLMTQGIFNPIESWNIVEKNRKNVTVCRQLGWRKQKLKKKKKFSSRALCKEAGE
jgi:hypothetical protein